MNEMTRLETLSLGGVSCFPNQQLKELSLGRDLKILRLEFLVALESLPHSGLLQQSSGSSVIAKFPMSSGSSVIANTKCLEIVKIEECATLLDLKIGELPALKRLAVEDGNYRLRRLPISIGCLANLQHLALGGGCVKQNVWNFAMTELPKTSVDW
jgi:hypothetical protein